VSYDGIAFNEIYNDPSVWDPSTAPLAEGDDQKGDGNPLTSNQVSLGTGADFDQQVFVRVRVKVGDLNATATITNLSVYATERIHTINPAISGDAPVCDDGSGSGCYGASSYDDAYPNWSCQDVGNEEFSIQRTWRSVDMCANEVTYIQQIRVGTAPTITVLRDTTLDFCHNETVSLIGPTYTDNCPASTLTVEWAVTVNGNNVVPNSGIGSSNPTITFPQPVLNDTTYIITWTITDDAGFETSAIQNINIKRPIQVALVPVGDPNFCSGESQAFTVTITGGTGDYDVPVIVPADSWSLIDASSGTYTTSGLTLDPLVNSISIKVTDNDVAGPPAIQGNCQTLAPFVFSSGGVFTLHQLIETPPISRD